MASRRPSQPVRVGIGGWTYAPWRGTFFPAGLPHAEELGYASRQLSSIEINGTYYRVQSAASFRKWRDETPDGFVFAVKGHRAVVNQARLGDAKEAIDWFLASGILELGEKLGPLLWQFVPFKRFDAADMAAFFARLPRELGGRPIHHAVEPRHGSFAVPQFVELARAAGIAIVYADSPKYPSIADLTGTVVYARLQNAAATEADGYPAEGLDLWAKRCRSWAAGAAIDDLPLLATPSDPTPRPVFVYMINGAKERAPAAAVLIERLWHI